MKTQTVKELRVIAKARNVRGYYTMKKAELIAALTTGGVVNLLDDPIPAIGVPILTPTPYAAPKQHSVFEKVKDNVNSFANWLLNYIPEKIKKKPVSEKLNALKSKVNDLFALFPP